VIVSAGAVTSVGLSAASTCAAIRAGLDDFAETHFVDGQSVPLLGARVPDEALHAEADTPGARLGGPRKLAAMFVRAATECARAAGGVSAASTALLLLGPEADRPGVTGAWLQECFEACQHAVGHSFHAASRITQIGSPGVAAALHYASELLHAGTVEHVLVAGVDSHLNTEDIQHSLMRQRLLDSLNQDGFIPGEAAACVLVRRCRHTPEADSLDRLPVLRVAGVGRAQEPQCLDEDLPSRGKGMGQAMRQALSQAALEPHAIHTRLSDATAESYFFEEASYAWARVLRERSPEGHRFSTPANQVGHVGAAMGPLLLALALDAARKRWAPGPHTLLQLSSAGPQRGAVVVSAA
jgi:3-oxoacyl-[acyl-carrier-protein] synthase I